MNWFDAVDLLSFIKQWGKLFMISFIAATVHMYMSGKEYAFFHHLMGVLVAVLAAYIATALCKWQNIDEDLTTGFVAICAYTAPHILDGINRLVQQLSQNPKGAILMLLKLKR
jgi:cytochrome b